MLQDALKRVVFGKLPGLGRLSFCCQQQQVDVDDHGVLMQRYWHGRPKSF